MASERQRIRVRLLVLLWIWAGCIALVLDLFMNVGEFDGIRPRALLYRAMRCVAHAMVGEPLPEGRPGATLRAMGETAAHAAPAPPALARPGARHPGGRPDAATPQGRKLRDSLVAAADHAEDPAHRRAAVRGLAGMFGVAAEDALAAIAGDPDQLPDVRDLADSLRRR